MRHRSEYLDNVKGLLVFLVILAHFLAETAGLSKAVNAVYIVLYTFHVPLFAFLSGYLSRSRRAREQAPRRFLPSYLFAAFGFSLFSDLVFHAYAHPGQPLGDFLAQGLHYLGKAALSVFLAPGPSWFLLSLISWRLLAPRAGRKRHLLWALLAALLAGGVGEIGYALSLSRTVVFFPFFLAGYLLDEEAFGRLAEKARRPAVWLPAAALFAAGVYGLRRLGVLGYDLLYGYTSYEKMGFGFFQGAAARLGVFILAGLASVCVLGLMPRKATVLARWGRRSLPVYVFHSFLLPLVAIGETALEIGLWYAPLSLVFAAAACVLFSSSGAERALGAVSAGVGRLLFGKREGEEDPDRAP